MNKKIIGVIKIKIDADKKIISVNKKIIGMNKKIIGAIKIKIDADKINFYVN